MIIFQLELSMLGKRYKVKVTHSEIKILKTRKFMKKKKVYAFEKEMKTNL